MTLSEWQANPELAESLRQELQKPIWVYALSVIESMSFTRKFASLEAFAISPNGPALAAQMIGYAKCQANLSLLTMQPETAVQQLTESYGINSLSQATE